MNCITMRKLPFLLVSALCFLVGCQSDTAYLTSSENGVVLSVSLAPTRVSLGNKAGDTYSAYWNEGDRLVANAMQSEVAIIDANDSSRATFKFSAEESLSYPLNITYP